MRSGELFAGVGGLGMAVDEVFGSTPAWFCEFDEAPSKVLTHRYPGVKNFGDVRSVDWATTEHVDILAGGFPCQDVSLAGRRAGMKDGTRSGLWAEYLHAIDVIRPDWVVIENVRGLASARAYGALEPCPWCLGDGADEYFLRALDAVVAGLSSVGYDATWAPVRASDVGAPHGRYRFFILAWPAAYTDDTTRYWQRTRAGSPVGTPESLTLLPTPAAGNFNDGEDAEQWQERRDRVKAQGINGNGMGMPLPIAVQLLPTPRTTDMNGAGEHGNGGLDLRTAVTMMPTPRATRGGSSTEMAYAMGGTRSDAERPQGVVVPGDGWGPYAPAIARWEAVLGRPAPAPVRFDGKGGKARLNPELTEWMMGWPAGWVTDPVIGLTRSEQLKACGDGVVTLQAVAALRELLARPGVPALEAA